TGYFFLCCHNLNILYFRVNHGKSNKKIQTLTQNCFFTKKAPELIPVLFTIIYQLKTMYAIYTSSLPTFSTFIPSLSVLEMALNGRVTTSWPCSRPLNTRIYISS